MNIPNEFSVIILEDLNERYVSEFINLDQLVIIYSLQEHSKFILNNDWRTWFDGNTVSPPDGWLDHVLNPPLNPSPPPLRHFPLLASLGDLLELYIYAYESRVIDTYPQTLKYRRKDLEEKNNIYEEIIEVVSDRLNNKYKDEFKKYGGFMNFAYTAFVKESKFSAEHPNLIHAVHSPSRSRGVMSRIIETEKLLEKDKEEKRKKLIEKNKNWLSEDESKKLEEEAKLDETMDKLRDWEWDRGLDF